MSNIFLSFFILLLSSPDLPGPPDMRIPYLYFYFSTVLAYSLSSLRLCKFFDFIAVLRSLYFFFPTVFFPS